MAGRSRKPFGARLGEKARARRLELGLSQAELADRLGMSPQELNRLERGRKTRGPGGEVLAELARALDIPPADLLAV